MNLKTTNKTRKVNV